MGAKKAKARGSHRWSGWWWWRSRPRSASGQSRRRSEGCSPCRSSLRHGEQWHPRVKGMMLSGEDPGRRQRVQAGAGQLQALALLTAAAGSSSGGGSSTLTLRRGPAGVQALAGRNVPPQAAHEVEQDGHCEQRGEQHEGARGHQRKHALHTTHGWRVGVGDSVGCRAGRAAP